MNKLRACLFILLAVPQAQNLARGQTSCCITPPIIATERNSCCECLPTYSPDAPKYTTEDVSFVPTPTALLRVFRAKGIELAGKLARPTCPTCSVPLHETGFAQELKQWQVCSTNVNWQTLVVTGKTSQDTLSSCSRVWDYEPVQGVGTCPWYPGGSVIEPHPPKTSVKCQGDEAKIGMFDAPARIISEPADVYCASVGVQHIFDCQVLVKCFFDGDPQGGFYWFKLGQREVLYGTIFKLISPSTWPIDLASVLAGNRRAIDLYSIENTTNIGAWVDLTCCDLDPGCGPSALDRVEQAEVPTPCP